MKPQAVNNILLALLYFGLSTLFTWWFVSVSPLYISREQMLLSTAVAGGKWCVQILLALIFLKDKRWVFIKHIGFVCLMGSVILLPFALLGVLGLANSASFFIGSLMAAVGVMIVYYRRAAKQAEVGLKWWYFWLVCLAIAITLQLTVVFQL